MNENNSVRSTARVNCSIQGIAAETLTELKKRGIVQNNREAVVQGLLALQERVTKSDIEKNKVRSPAEQMVWLRAWDEVIGTLTGIETTDTDIVALLTCTIEKHAAITIPTANSDIQQQLKKLLGRRIAILRTEDPSKPFMIRLINETQPENPNLIHKGGTKQQLQFRGMYLHGARGFVICSLPGWIV